jgi:SAM-dependent methyltransferase
MELFGPHGRTRTWLRHKKFKLLTSIGRTLGNDVVENALTSRRDLADFLGGLQSAVPQGQIVDTSVTTCDHREWRKHFAGRLQGRGLELGPLHRPIPVHDGMRMTYVDYQDQATLQQAYPKLAKHIVPVDILDDAQTLATVAPASFDFLISAHVIEHMRNPIGALVNWLRAVRDGGLLYLIVPDKRRTFDKLRVRTTLEHLVLDYEQPSAERDFEHFLDYAVFVHHAQTDQAIGEAARLRDTDFSIHFHVFLPQDVVRLVQWIDGHVTPVSIVEGPVISPAIDEFHLLLRKGTPS